MESLGEFIKDNQYLQHLYISQNQFTDKAIETLSGHLAGNTELKYLCIQGNKQVTDVSTPYLVEIAKHSCIDSINIAFTSIGLEYANEIKAAFELPIDQREIPLFSSSKSAAKASA